MAGRDDFSDFYSLRATYIDECFSHVSVHEQAILATSIHLKAFENVLQ